MYRFVRRGGIYAARCNHADIATQRVNRTERSRPFPTNRPKIRNRPVSSFFGSFVGAVIDRPPQPNANANLPGNVVCGCTNPKKFCKVFNFSGFCPII